MNNFATIYFLDKEPNKAFLKNCIIINKLYLTTAQINKSAWTLYAYRLFSQQCKKLFRNQYVPLPTIVSAYTLRTKQGAIKNRHTAFT